ncbi:MAG: bacillithiol system redox-active protein YtxJ [Rhodothermales bacterium]|nr:bacillithiol system redox-active protein YtxJ [Rhodothermales bacterium]
MFTEIQTTDQLDQVIAASEVAPQVVFKHSSRCGLSASAHRSLSVLSSQDPPVFILTVQDSRKLSNEIEERFQIRHESPQIIIFSGGEPVFNSSHRRATSETVRECVSTIETQD